MTQLRPVVRDGHAAEEVQRQLVRLIEAGSLGIGAKLPSEYELGRTFGVSRPIVREALVGLRTMGLVTSKSGRGTFVASNRPFAGGLALLGGASTTGELYEVRSHLEVPGASLAARRRTSEQVARLADIVAQQDECGDPEEWVRLDAAFHFALAEATWNHVQVRLVGNLRELLVEQSLALASVPGRIAAATGEHRAILEAVRAGDEAGARAAMARHLDGIQTESHRVGTDTTQGRGSHR